MIFNLIHESSSLFASRCQFWLVNSSCLSILVIDLLKSVLTTFTILHQLVSELALELLLLLAIRSLHLCLRDLHGLPWSLREFIMPCESCLDTHELLLCLHDLLALRQTKVRTHHVMRITFECQHPSFVFAPYVSVARIPTPIL